MKRMFNVEIIGVTVAVFLILAWILIGIAQGLSFGDIHFAVNESFFNRLSDIALWCFGALGIKSSAQAISPTKESPKDKEEQCHHDKCTDENCKCTCHNNSKNDQ